jgi:hypothetical protein
MGKLVDVKTAGPGEIHGCFEAWIGGRAASRQEELMAAGLAKPLIGFWCWMRDQGEVKKSRSSLRDLTRLAGAARGLQFLKRRDAPEALKRELLAALDKHLPLLDPALGGANEWDDRLHSVFFAKFVEAIVYRTRQAVVVERARDAYMR